MLINVTFIIIIITFFNYIGEVLSSKSKPEPNISLKRLHTSPCQPRVWHFLFFIFTVFKNTSHWQKLSGKPSLYWHLPCLQNCFRPDLKHSLASTSWMCARAQLQRVISTHKQGLHQAALVGSYSLFSWLSFTPRKPFLVLIGKVHNHSLSFAHLACVLLVKLLPKFNFPEYWSRIWECHMELSNC